jgi:hypothetical protein
MVRGDLTIEKYTDICDSLDNAIREALDWDARRRTARGRARYAKRRLPETGETYVTTIAFSEMPALYRIVGEENAMGVVFGGSRVSDNVLGIIVKVRMDVH